MNEEIKETLKYLGECVANDNRFLIGNTNATKLSYYIINLQVENKNLKETNEEHRKINGDLRKENQKLVKVFDELEKELQEAYKELQPNELINGRELISNILAELKGDNNDEI